jgi:hypothetical protein
MFCMLLFNFVNHVFLYYVLCSFVSLSILIAMCVPFCVFRLVVLFCVLFVCKCVLYYWQWVSTQLQLNIWCWWWWYDRSSSSIGGSPFLPHSLTSHNILQSKSWLPSCSHHYCDAHRSVFQHKEIPFSHYLGHTHGYDRPHHFVTKHTSFTLNHIPTKFNYILITILCTVNESKIKFYNVYLNKGFKPVTFREGGGENKSA